VDLLNELEEIKRREMGKKKELEKLKSNFYSDVIKKIEELHSQARMLVEKMDIEGAGRLMNKIKRIQNSFETIISLRIRKILLFSIWKEEREIKNLTPEEKLLYLEVKDAVERHKNRVMGREEELPVKEKPSQVSPKKEEKAEKKEERYVLARVKIPFTVALPEGELELRKEDVLHIPEKIFRILGKKDIVEEVRLKD